MIERPPGLERGHEATEQRARDARVEQVIGLSIRGKAGGRLVTFGNSATHRLGQRIPLNQGDPGFEHATAGPADFSVQSAGPGRNRRQGEIQPWPLFNWSAGGDLARLVRGVNAEAVLHEAIHGNLTHENAFSSQDAHRNRA